MHIMGTGSRSLLLAPDAKEIYLNLQEKILMMKKIREEDFGDTIILISGMAEGWDEAIAKIGYRNGIPYKCVIPTSNYGEYYWGSASVIKKNRLEIFDGLVAGATAVVYLDDPSMYGPPTFIRRGSGPIPGPNYCVDGVWIHANMLRNQVMVDMADYALVYKPTSRGTRDCVARLASAKVPYEVSPFNLNVQQNLPV